MDTKTNSIFTSQDFAGALESPTSQPRINKGDLWQGRERKKRGKETSDPSPARKYQGAHTHGQARVVLRLQRRLNNSDYFHSAEKERGSDRLLPHLCRGRLPAPGGVGRDSERAGGRAQPSYLSATSTGYLKPTAPDGNSPTLTINSSLGEESLS